ncbi:MAG: DUF4430 domain-containing protein [Ignavibacteriales bacterium]
MNKKLISIFLIILFLLSGCSLQKGPSLGNSLNIQLTVSKDFSENIIFDKKIQAESGDTIMDILEKNLDVETASDGFVNAINGLKSEMNGMTSKDWFFYVNGIASNCSAKAYHLRQGDKILWDYHEWDGNSFIPAIIGAYPEPFINGFEGKTAGVRIYYADEFKDEALKLKESLGRFKAKNVNTAPLGDSFETKPGFPSIIIGEYGKISNNKIVAKLISDNGNKGIFARFSKNAITLLDYSGMPKKVDMPISGVVCATADSLGDTAPVWIITSIEHKQVENLINLIYSKEGSIKDYYGAALIKGKLERLPN